MDNPRRFIQKCEFFLDNHKRESKFIEKINDDNNYSHQFEHPDPNIEFSCISDSQHKMRNEKALGM